MNPDGWAGLGVISLFLPILVALLKQGGWNDQTNSLIAYAVYAVAGVAYVVVTTVPGGITMSEVIGSIGEAAVVGSIAYTGFWSNMGVTSPGKPSWDDLIRDLTSLWKPKPDAPKNVTPTADGATIPPPL